MTPLKTVRVASVIRAGAKPGTKPLGSRSMVLWADTVCRTQNPDRQTKHSATFFILLLLLAMMLLSGLRCEGVTTSAIPKSGKASARRERIQVEVDVLSA